MPSHPIKGRQRHAPTLRTRAWSARALFNPLWPLQKARGPWRASADGHQPSDGGALPAHSFPRPQGQDLWTLPPNVLSCPREQRGLGSACASVRRNLGVFRQSCAGAPLAPPSAPGNAGPAQPQGHAAAACRWGKGQRALSKVGLGCTFGGPAGVEDGGRNGRASASRRDPRLPASHMPFEKLLRPCFWALMDGPQCTN